MENILTKILDVKYEEVARAKEERPLAELESQLADLPTCRDFFGAMADPSDGHIHVIAEIKRASPSAGLIRADFDPITLARLYADCGSHAISVLTDETFFQGHLDYLREVKEAVSLPLLRKDFIVDPYQVYEARCAGADAVLLIAEALEADRVEHLTVLAESLGLTVLIEVHEHGSLLGVMNWLGGNEEQRKILIGINNRNLKTMEVDLRQSLDMRELIGPFRGAISESGIRERSHVERLIEAGFDGILIGETLMRSKNIADKYSELFGL